MPPTEMLLTVQALAFYCMFKKGKFEAPKEKEGNYLEIDIEHAGG